MSEPTTAANPLHLFQFATRTWLAERAAGDVSHQQFEPLLARWNQARAAAGLSTSYLDVHIGVLLHSFLNVDDWVFAVARAFAAADGRYLYDSWPPGSPTTREGVILTPASDPDALVTAADAGPLAALAAAGPEKVPGPADVDPALAGAGDPFDPSSASWALGNLGLSAVRQPDASAGDSVAPPPATLQALGAAPEAPRPSASPPVWPRVAANPKRQLRIDKESAS
jgi:hypothetical protein